MKRFTASNKDAIALASILRTFSEGKHFNIKTLYSTMQSHGHGSHSQSRQIMRRLRSRGIVTSHGRSGNKFHRSDVKSTTILKDIV